MRLVSVVLLAALLSACNPTHLVTTRAIKAGEVIQASDLKTDRHYGRRWGSVEDWTWATPGDRSKVVGHKAKVSLDSNWHFKISEIER